MTMADLFLKAPTTRKVEPPPVYTLLLVDDEPNVLSSLRRVFQDESYRVVTATNADEALEALVAEPVHLVITDHRMPGTTGADFLRMVRSRWPDTIRMMLTGYADVESVVGAVNEGAVFKFMTKPWQEDDLRITVARAFEQYQLQQEVRALRAQNERQEEHIEEFSAVFSQERGMLAKLLLRDKKITREQFDRAVAEQRKSGEAMYRVLVGTVGIPEDEIRKAVETSMGLEPLDINETRISPDAAGLVPPEFCQDHLILPVRLEGGVLTVAMADPTDIFKHENLERVLGLRLAVVAVRATDLKKRIETVYGAVGDDNEVLMSGGEEIDIVIEDDHEETSVQDLLSSSVVPPVVRIVNAVITEALRHGASDVHLEPRLKYTAVRFRIDGLIEERMRLPANLHAAVSSRIKVLAKMDIAQKRRPQDGRITVRATERMVDLRVSTLPTLHGENIVLRILDRGGEVRRVEDLGLDDENLGRVRAVVRKPQGILICTGPTGSGKTTMLYSLLREHLNPAASYGTIEDPVEYYIESAAQVHVREKTGLTFPVALRSMLRQDPDVILVGEIRDLETAQIAFQAALTGHFVLSTLHTNNAVGTVTRLVNLGVERYLIASGLECVIAQRLLRLICRRCVRRVKPSHEVLHLLNLREDDLPELSAGTGCEACHNAGYAGRVGVFEVLDLTDRLRELVLVGAREAELAEVARECGMKTLFEDAMNKVAQGNTTLNEVLRVLGPRTITERPCPGCTAPIDPTFKVCPVCGFIVRHVCPKCGVHIEPKWKFCPSCGRPAVLPTESR